MFVWLHGAQLSRAAQTGQYHGEVDAERMQFYVLFVIFVNA